MLSQTWPRHPICFAIELYKIMYKFDIKKQHWERYQIMYIKLNQYKHYRMGETDKYK